MLTHLITKETINTLQKNLVQTAQSNAEVSANTYVRNVDRVFKYNNRVRDPICIRLK